MELNKRTEMNEIPVLAIGRQSYDIVSPENEHQSGASVWSPVDCNGGGPSTMNDIWDAEWRTTIPNDLPHTHSLQAQHRAKRQHCWGTASSIADQQEVGPSSAPEDDSIKSLDAELFGCCETVAAGNTGFDFFQPPSNLVSTNRTCSPPHSFMLVSNSRPAIADNETGHWNTTVPQGSGFGAFFSECDWKNRRDPLLSELAETTKGKGVEQFHTVAGGSGTELNGCQDSSYFSSVLLSQREHEVEKSGSPIECISKQRTEEPHGDIRSAFKRKLSPLDVAEPTSFESRFTASNDSAASRAGGFGTILGQTGFTNFHPISSSSTTSLWGEPCNESTFDYTCNDIHSSRGLMERTPGLYGSGEDATGRLTSQHLHAANDTQLHSQVLFARNLRRSGHAHPFPNIYSHPFPRRNPESGTSNPASSATMLENIDHWPSLGGEISPAPFPPITISGPGALRRNNSAFPGPVSRERVSSQGLFEGVRLRSMPSRTFDRAMAAAAAAVPPAGAPDQRLTSQRFPSVGVAAPPAREAEPPESSARITQVPTSFFNPGVLASYFPAPASDTPRVSINPSQPVSTTPSHEVSARSSLEPYMSVSEQPVGRSSLVSPSRARRDSLFSAPVQSLLGLPFRGLHTLRADGEYRRQFLSEILNAMHNAFHSEDLNVEELVMLDPSIIYGDHNDQHRDMRLDVDNMTYEELLALEERIGNVSTGLDEAKISLCLRESKYSSLDATVAAISQDSDVKCSICQEEFAEEDEMGRLDCGHGYHSACIKQWLLQKNECPICKSSAYTKP